MPSTTIVRDPERMSVTELNTAQADIRRFESETGQMAGIVLIQRRQSSGLYEIVSAEEAKGLMSRPVVDDGNGNRTAEWGQKVYYREDLEMLKRIREQGELYPNH